MRPRSIARLHEAKYELHFCGDTDKESKFAAFQKALADAAAEFHTTEHQLESVLRGDYIEWQKQERLPRTSRKRL